MQMLLISSFDGPLRRGSDELSFEFNDECLRRGSGKLFADQRVMFGLLVMPTRNAGEFVRVGLWYSVAKGLGGRRLWEDVQPQIIRLV